MNNPATPRAPSHAAVQAFGTRAWLEQVFVDGRCRSCGERIGLSWGEWEQVEMDVNGAYGFRAARHKCKTTTAQPSVSAPV